MARGITETDVFTACDALLLAGERPTIERVRQKIGRGSPNTVSPMLDTWFKGLGRRLQDPGAFAAPPGAPDPVLQAARHLWEIALAQTRLDLDQRLSEGLACAHEEAERERGNAVAATRVADNAMATAERLQSELVARGKALDVARQALAAESARLEEVRARASSSAELQQVREATLGAEIADLKRQLEAAVQRADAADRRVALELERERAARAKAERQGEAIQKSWEAARVANHAAAEDSRQRLEALQAQATGLGAELALERLRASELRDSQAAATSEAASAHAQLARQQASLDRLSRLLESANLRGPKAVRKRLVKPSVVE